LTTPKCLEPQKEQIFQRILIRSKSRAKKANICFCLVEEDRFEDEIDDQIEDKRCSQVFAYMLEIF